MFRKTATIAFALLLAVVFFSGCGRKVNENLVKGKAAYENKDYENAVASLLLAAQDGDAEAQYLLGRCYGDGKGVEEDEAESQKWIRKSADQGFAKSLFVMGIFEDMKDNTSEAEKWFKKAIPGVREAVEKGDSDAAFLLASAYAGGAGVEPDKEEAKKLLRKAAEMGNEDAKEFLEAIDMGGRN